MQEMASQNGTIIASPQVVVNKAARRIFIERKNVRRELADDIDGENSKVSNDAVPTPPSSANEELEEGEIAADRPSTSGINQSPADRVILKRQHSSEDSPTQNDGPKSVQRKLTALERLKSLNFSVPKSTVNPFTVALPKPAPTISSVESKIEKRHNRPLPPLKKQRELAVPDVQKNRIRPYQQLRQGPARLGLGRSKGDMCNNSFHSGPVRWFQPPETFPVREEVRLSTAGPQAPPNLSSWSASDEVSEKMPDDERHYLSPRFGSHNCVPAPPPPNEVVQEDTPPPTYTSSICWKDVRELKVTQEEMNNFSAADLRAIVQYLLDEETELIHLHLRLQDQMKNVRRALDREKQIDQLKKQALAATLTAKDVTKEQLPETRKGRRKGRKITASMEGRHDAKADVKSEDVSGSQPSSQFELEGAFLQALDKSIREQADARKAHLLRYLTNAAGEYATSGASSFDYDKLHVQSSKCDESSSTAVSREKCVAMLKSFFDGIASMNDRSLFQESTDL